MTNVVRFPVDYPAHQWAIRQKILGFMELLGWDMARAMMGYCAAPSEHWVSLEDECLPLMLDYVQEEYALLQFGKKLTAAAVTTAPAKNPARVYTFPAQPGAQPKKQAKRQAKTKENTARKQIGQAPAKPSAKARLIRKVKMLQRDCEKTLPEFTDLTYRAILQERFGVSSSTKLDDLRLVNLALYLQAMLFNSQKKAKGKASYDAPELLRRDPMGLGREKIMGKIEALLAEKGRVEGKYVRWSYALGILKRQTCGVVEDWVTASPKQLDAVVAALTTDARRKGRRIK